MADQMPIYSQVVPKSQYRGKSSKSGVRQTTRPDFDPLNCNNGGNFLNSPTEKEREREKERKDRRERSRDETRARRSQNRNEANDSKVEAYLRQNQVSMRQQQHRHSAVRQAEHRVNLRSLQLNDVVAPRGHDRTPTERHRGFPGDKDTREHRREKEKDRDRDRDNFDCDGTPLSPLAPRHDSSRPVRKSSSAHRVSETPIATSKRRFFCREWAFQKIAHCLEQRPVSNTCGALILGDAGSGKTALCQELSEPSQGPQARQQRALNRRLLARHFLQANNETSLRPGEFVRSLAMQLLSHSSKRSRTDFSPRTTDHRHDSEEERLVNKFRGLGDDCEESSKPLLADSEDQRTDEEEVGSAKRLHSEEGALPEILPRSSSKGTNPFVPDSKDDCRLYENHENLFLRNISHRQSKDARLLRQSSEPLSERTTGVLLKSLSAEHSASETEKPKVESSPPKSRIPVANFRYPHKNDLRSTENSPQKVKSEKQEAETEIELPEYQNVLKPDQIVETPVFRSVAPEETLAER
ncbi:hypothetical protein ACJJTC_019211 [Scirpophaga incertulas]